MLTEEITVRGDFPGGPVVGTSPSSAGSVGLIPGWGAKIPHAASRPKNQNIKQKQYCDKFNKDLKKKGPHQKNLKKKKEITVRNVYNANKKAGPALYSSP